MNLQNWTRVGCLLAAAAALTMTAVGCGNETVDDANPADNNGPGGKGDVPDLHGEEACQARQKDVAQAGRTLFVDGAIRWAVSDVEGVNTVGRDDRGQEYTEYFAIVRDIPADPVATEEALGAGTIFGHPGTERAVELDADQKDFLDLNPDARVGSCVFTSWHQDITDPLPACAAGECPKIDDVEVTAEFFRMTSTINSNNAAYLLVRDCLANPPAGDPADAADPLHDPFFRGCMKCAELNEQGLCVDWRRSDPAICAAAGRLVECGCSVAGAEDPAAALVPPPEVQRATSGGITLRGFKLGTWTGIEELPNGCQYVETGAEANGKRANVIVACDIFAGDLADWAHDPKEYCRQNYGDDVVVHVPFDPSVLSCEPAAEGQYTSSCGEKPWILYPEQL